MRHLIQQSYDIFNIYGRDPENLSNVLKAFDMVLKDIPMRYVAEGFEIWLRVSSKFPTPADIHAHAKERYDLARAKAENNIPTKNRPRPKEPHQNAVPWAFLPYHEIVDRGLLQSVRDHIRALKPENAKDYIVFLKSFCNFPREFQA